MKAKLVVVGGAKRAEVNVTLPATLGRSSAVAVPLPHPLVSRRHCELFAQEGHIYVRDLGSLNGTFVNNERVTQAQLPPGSLLTVGLITLRAEYDVLPQVAIAADDQEGTVDGEPVADTVREGREQRQLGEDNDKVLFAALSDEPPEPAAHQSGHLLLGEAAEDESAEIRGPSASALAADMYPPTRSAAQPVSEEGAGEEAAVDVPPLPADAVVASTGEEIPHPAPLDSAAEDEGQSDDDDDLASFLRRLE